ncbi:MAG: von Willebrand factor type A domain-containing protein [Bacteroidota bacterium]
MKAACHILIFLISGSSLFAQQYYIRGEVKDGSGNFLQNVKILQHKTGYVFKSGNEGTFGIVSNQQVDTFSFSLYGYQPETMLIKADDFVTIILKLQPPSFINVRHDKLASLTKDLGKEEQKTWFTGDETYASIIENRFINSQKFPNTGMSLNIDRASYSNIRRFITLNSFVPPDAVRMEEMLNYFNLNYSEPEGKDVFKINTTISSCPWNAENQLYYINLSSKKINLDTLPPSHLVFLIDVSGSMDMPNRLPLLKSAFRLLVNNLREKDSVSIVVYGGTVGAMLNTTSGCEKEKILKAIDELTPGGGTPGESGIKLAYSIARNHFIKGGNNRVILATDGDFNVGLKTEDELDELISKQQESGVYLTCLGVGMGNYKDSKIQLLAKRGNGNFAYFDNFQEAEKVLLSEFTQTIYAVADNVFMNVEFNPDYVKEYRLIGFDNKMEALKDSLSTITGGEIGSAYSMVAMFEIIPTDSNRNVIKKKDIASGIFSRINLRYQLPNDTTHFQFNDTTRFNYFPFNEIEKNYQFSASVVMFGSMLRSSPYTKNVSWNDILELAQKSSATDDPLHKEFISLVDQAKTIYTKAKKKKTGAANKKRQREE